MWLTVLLLTAHWSASAAPCEGTVAYATSFEEDADADYDGWPDGWTRRRGAGYPRYLNIGIADDPAGETSLCLRIELDGGAAMVCSPPIKIDPQYNYVLQGKLKTEQLKRDVAFVNLTFLDSLDPRQQRPEPHRSAEYTVAPTWQAIQIGPLAPTNPGARYAVIELHLTPTERADLRGAAMFDDISLTQLPRMSITTPLPQNLHLDTEQVAVTCGVSGVPQLPPLLQLELLDATGRCVDRASLPWETSAAGADAQTTGTASAPAASDDPGTSVSAGSLTWRPQIPGCGYYVVRAVVESDGQVVLQQTASLVVMRPATDGSRSEFGWSLARGNSPLANGPLVNLLEKSGVAWLKCPVWSDPADTQELDRLADLADRLHTSGIEMVGVLDAAPTGGAGQISPQHNRTVAEMFWRPEIWQPQVDPLMERLGLKLRHWQIGSDGDSSLADFEHLESTLRGVRAHWKQAGHAARLGLAWNWLYEVPAVADPPWDVLAMAESLPFTGRELTQYAATSAVSRSQRWMTLEPLSRTEYSPTVRAQDLVMRMLAAKIQGAGAIFVRNPFDEERGLLHHDGTPSELFLPWRNTAEFVRGATYLGSMSLPGGSRNYVFAREHDALLIVWNDVPVQETLYLGEQVQQTTLWGEQIDLPFTDEQGRTTQTVAVGPLPLFVTGLNLAAVQWQLQCVFEPNQLTGEFDRQQITRLRFRNTFPDRVQGTATLHVPDTWELSTASIPFQLGNEEALDQELGLLLRAESSNGPQRVRIDFAVEADHPYHFSVYRDLQVGAGDAAVELDCWLDDSDQLIVEPRLVNRTGSELNFNCYLYAPGRRRLRQQLLDIGPGRVTSAFVLPKGRELVGKTLWLRAEEIGGSRVLNARVIAEP